MVDSSGVSRELVARILTSTLQGVQVTSCSSGREALDRLGDEPYGLITTSLALPDMDGLDLCRTIRQTEGHRHTPLIVVSGEAGQRLAKEGFAAGVTDYFDKSLGYPAFAAFIKEFCRRNSGVVGRVLFVEDSNTAAAITRRSLERHGLHITHVTSAEQALDYLERRGPDGLAFDLVITDFYLKGAMTGGDLLHTIRVRFHYSRQELPVLMITGQEDQQLQRDAFYAGANDFVRKPLVEEELMGRVRSLLLIRQLHDALQRQSQGGEAAALPLVPGAVR